ncbi:hypothetical protein DFH07DRAFT_944646 [Mycena maculata]|uniref:Myb-like domain-containing protein n=1 Tax=Mycena maculata TaxID=230809 RepID=A0AAD7MW60_9AGAR|nr:hypothetical protein DFH07DRAFT_944646 [Mycena maculata]
MDSRRAQTLEALNTFIAQQKALLARTKSDLETLRRLGSDAVADAATSAVADVGTLADQLGSPAFRLSDQADCALSVPALDWSLFAQTDPKPLQSLAHTARTTSAYAQRNIPRPTPRAGPGSGDLQKLVREAKKAILDPVFAAVAAAAQEEEPPTPISPAKEGFKERGNEGCNKRMPPRGPSGLFARRPRVPAPPPPPSASTTFSMEHGEGEGDDASTTAVAPSPSSTRCRSPPSPSASNKYNFHSASNAGDDAEEELPMALAKPVRARRISTKLQRQNLDRSDALPLTRARRASEGVSTRARRDREQQKVVQPPPPPQPRQPRQQEPKPRQRLTLILPAAKPKPKIDLTPTPTPTPKTEEEERPAKRQRTRKARPSTPPSGPDLPFTPNNAETPDADTPTPEPEPAPPSVLGKRTRSTKPKPRPDTYKVVWSAEEQNQLERLLEEIPVGDPKRYLKISLAMDGRRTPRQVASRVQKYMQKLKKYGVAD